MIKRLYETEEQRLQLLVDVEMEGLVLFSKHTDLEGITSLLFMTAEDHALYVEANIQKSLEVSDRKMIRVVDDLVDVLLDKGLLAPEDLPTEAIDRIAQRKALRDSLGSSPG